MHSTLLTLLALIAVGCVSVPHVEGTQEERKARYEAKRAVEERELAEAQHARQDRIDYLMRGSMTKEERTAKIAKQPASVRRAIEAGKVSIGMSKMQLILSWGMATDINRSGDGSGVEEQWVYRKGSLERSQ